jgi:hypothetical protein
MDKKWCQEFCHKKLNGPIQEKRFLDEGQVRHGSAGKKKEL